MTVTKKKQQPTSLQKVFTFNPSNQTIRSEVINQQPFFIAKDVCDALSISNNRDALKKLDEDEKGVVITDTLGGKQKLTAVNESGLYSLIFQSRKPEAKVFRKWVTSEVLPAIRKTGTYTAENGVNVSQHLVKTLPGRKKREGFNIETLRMLWLVDSHLIQGDKKAVALEVGVSEQTINLVINGYIRSPRVLWALYERAMVNSKNMRVNLYSNPNEVVKQLKGGALC